ncbi:MAG: YceD family protein, partial [Geminicoccales bacterium]
VRASITEEFLPSVDPESGAPVRMERGEGEGAQQIDPHHEIQLAGVFHDELSLTEPMHPLCRPDCPGLCAECGEKLDHGDHAHGGEEIDPRLAGLAALLRDGDAEGR